MKYQLNKFNRNISDQELLDDMRDVAEKLKVAKLSSRDYDNSDGKYTSGTIGVRFGGWNAALERAGLDMVNYREVSEIELFKNIENVWTNIGRQPVFRDIKAPLSKHTTHQYITKFGSWIKALEAFIEYINSDTGFDDEIYVPEEIPLGAINKTEVLYKHLTKRIPSERLKVQVLMRDGNKCKLCGVILTGKDIHFDHIIPWSKGGETLLENLQVLCVLHNLAKGNLEYNIPNL